LPRSGEVIQEKHRWFNPKTKKGIRELPIPAELVTALGAWKEKCPKSRLDLVFCNEFGEPCNRTGIGRYGLAPALEQAKIEKAISMHSLRHTYASMLILLKKPITDISEYLGSCGFFDHDAGLCSLLEAQETGHDERPRAADSERMSFSMAQPWHSLTREGKNITVTS
jgi:Phage integrase family